MIWVVCYYTLWSQGLATSEAKCPPMFTLCPSVRPDSKNTTFHKVVLYYLAYSVLTISFLLLYNLCECSFHRTMGWSSWMPCIEYMFWLPTKTYCLPTSRYHMPPENTGGFFLFIWFQNVNKK